MRTLDLAAVRALPAVGDQPRDRWADQRNLLDELLDRLDLFNPASTLRAARQGHVDFRIDVGGNDAVGTGVPLGATGPSALLIRDLLGVSTPERRRLTSCLALGLVELVAEGLVLGHQV